MSREYTLPFVLCFLGPIVLAGLITLCLMAVVPNVHSPDPAADFDTGSITFEGAPPGRDVPIYRAIDCDSGLLVYLSADGGLALWPLADTTMDVGDICNPTPQPGALESSVLWQGLVSRRTE